jgi:competence protein ComEA
MTKIIVGVLIVTIIGLIAFAFVDKVTGAIISTPDNSLTVESSYDTLTITITGEVKKTGTYIVPLSSKLSAVIEAAGGATTNADPKAYDGDYPVLSKQSFYIAPIYDNSSTCTVTPISKVNINSADKSTLQGVTAISSTIAGAIIDYRTSNGSFGRIEDLKNVTGIGNATFEKVKNFVQIMD